MEIYVIENLKNIKNVISGEICMIVVALVTVPVFTDVVG